MDLYKSPILLMDWMNRYLEYVYAVDTLLFTAVSKRAILLITSLISLIIDQNQDIFQHFNIQMLQASCYSPDQCSSMFHCQQNTCVHDDIFPLSTYTIFIYVFMGVAASFTNVAGNSMGQFKLPILMFLLNYQLGHANGLAQATIVGASLSNFVSIILKKHPNGLTSLVNYKVLALIIPCSLLGSVLGSIAQTLTPKILQFALHTILFSYFVYNYIRKLRATIDRKNSTLIDSSNNLQKNQPQQISNERLQLLKYQKSYHLKQIFIGLAVFLVFQSLVFLVQGKFPFYKVSKCSPYYFIGIGVLLVVTIIYLIFARKILRRIQALYRKHQIYQQIYLDGNKEFFCVAAAGLGAGFSQGLLGVGSGNVIITVLLALNVIPAVASPTAGYQILFSGTGSLLEYYIIGQIQILQSLWMLGVCFVIGGSLTTGLYQIIKRLDQQKVSRFLISIVIFLCLMNIGLIGPTIKGVIDKDGWEGMTKISFKC